MVRLLCWILPGWLCLMACTGRSELAVPQVGAAGAVGDPTDNRPVPPLLDNEGPTTPFVAARASMQLLLSWQVRNAVADLLGEGSAAALSLTPDESLNGFASINASQISVSPLSVARLDESARAAAAAALATDAQRKALYGCTPSGINDTRCFGTFLSKIGRRAFRRTLDADELSAWVKVANDAATAYGSFQRGAESALAAMLQSPSFLYMTAIGEPDPSDASKRRLTGVELATRLAFFLTGTLPDDALLQAAESGGLESAEDIRQQARTLLQSPRAKAALARLFDEMFLLGNVPKLTKASSFTLFSPALANALRDESQAFFQELFLTGTDFRDVLSADYSFMNSTLAQLYQVPFAGAGAWEKTPLPASTGRAGFLGQGAFLATGAHASTTSPTRRGRFVRQNILCESVADPPTNVDLTAVSTPSPTPMTMRARLAEHQSNPSCSGCHVQMDNIGLALEHFDPIGAYRERDQGLALDTQMTTPDIGTFSNPRELGMRLRDDPRFTRCMTLRLFRSAAGRVETEGEATPLRVARQRFANTNYDARELLIELVSSAAFRYLAVSP